MQQPEASRSEAIETSLAGEIIDQQPPVPRAMTDDSIGVPSDAAGADISVEGSENVTDLEAYRARIQRLNVVSARLVERVKLDDQAAFERLWTHIFPFVVKVARNQPSILPLEERIQVAALRITGHVRKFNPDLSVFSDYVVEHIKGAIKDEERRISRSNGLTRGDFTTLQTIAEGDDQPEELQKLVEGGFIYAPKLIQDGKVRQGVASLEKLIHEDPHMEGENNARQPRADVDVFEEVAMILDSEALGGYIAKLPPSQQIAVRHFYGVNGFEQMTGEKIARDLLGGVSSSRVSQLTRLGLENLKNIMSGEELIGYRNRLQSIKPAGKQETREEFLERVEGRLDNLHPQLLSGREVEFILELFPDWVHTLRNIDGTDKHVIDRGLGDLEIDQDAIEYEQYTVQVSQQNTKIAIITDEIRASEVRTIIEIEREVEKFLRENRISSPEQNSPADTLSPRQKEVLKRMFQVNAQIAYELGVSVSTVRTHMSAAMKAFGVNTERELAVEAARAGAIDLLDIPHERTSRLTDLEKQLISDFYKMSNDEIATAKGRSVQTIRAQLHKIYEKTGAISRTQATFFAIVDGLITLSEEPEQTT